MTPNTKAPLCVFSFFQFESFVADHVPSFLSACRGEQGEAVRT